MRRIDNDGLALLQHSEQAQPGAVSEAQMPDQP